MPRPPTRTNDLLTALPHVGPARAAALRRPSAPRPRSKHNCAHRLDAQLKTAEKRRAAAEKARDAAIAAVEKARAGPQPRSRHRRLTPHTPRTPSPTAEAQRAFSAAFAQPREPTRGRG